MEDLRTIEKKLNNLSARGDEIAEKTNESLSRFSRAALKVFEDACDRVDDFIHENPDAVPGAILVAGSLILPTLVGLSIPEVIDMYHRGAPHTPIMGSDIGNMLAPVVTNMYLFNEGVKRVTNGKTDLFK